jgi:ribosomal protein L37E
MKPRGGGDGVSEERLLLEECRAGGGYSFRDRGRWHLVRCHACGRENYAPAVNSGRCAGCGAGAPAPETEGRA